MAIGNRERRRLLRSSVLRFPGFTGFSVIGENHPKAGNNHYLPPYKLGSHASRLIKLLNAGHYEVKMPLEDWIRLTTWVDSNGQYYGTYFGRKNLVHQDHPDFRPVATFEETQDNYAQ